MSVETCIPAITSDHIQQLAVLGSVQLDAAYSPENYDRLAFAAADEDDIHGYRSFEKIANAFPQLRTIHAAVLQLAGYVPDATPPIKATVLHQAQASNDIHVDFGGMSDLKGYSIAISKRRVSVGSNSLYTAGRGPLPEIRETKYSYDNGPVLLAQRNFSVPGITHELGPTWHRGSRTTIASFIALDIIVPLR